MAKEGGNDFLKALLTGVGLATAAASPAGAQQERPGIERPRTAADVLEGVTMPEEVLNGLGTGRFAENREAAFSDESIAEATEGLVRALDPALLERQTSPDQLKNAIQQLLLAHRGTQGTTTFLSPIQRFEGMLGRRRNGEMQVLGEGADHMQLNTRLVEGTRAGFVAYTAEQITGSPIELADGTRVRIVIHRPHDCENFTIDIIEIPEEHPAPPQAQEGEPCTVVAVPGLPPGTRVAMPVVWAESEADADRPSECWAVSRGDERDFRMPVCEGDTCEYLESAIAFIQPTRPSGRRDRLTGVVYEAVAGEDGVARVRIPRSVRRNNGTNVEMPVGGYWVGACPKDLVVNGRRVQTNMRIAEPGTDLTDGEHSFTPDGWRLYRDR